MSSKYLLIDPDAMRPVPGPDRRVRVRLEPEVTSWYHVSTWPAVGREGVYQTASEPALINNGPYSWRKWLGTGWSRARDTWAGADAEILEAVFQPTTIFWRGVTKDV